MGNHTAKTRPASRLTTYLIDTDIMEILLAESWVAGQGAGNLAYFLCFTRIENVV